MKKHISITSLLKVASLSGFLFLGCVNAESQKTQSRPADDQVASVASVAGQSSGFKTSLAAEKAGSDLVVDVVKAVIPSVVSIHSEKIVEVRPHQYFNPLEEFFGMPRQQQRSRKHKQQGLGSGVIVSKEGLVLTNHHVAGEADEIKITLSDERVFEAEVVGSDKLSDVAVLKIKNPPKDLPVSILGDSDELQVGETVLAIGNPFGYSNTVTKGIISAKRRTVGINSYENYLQTDASINPGNSGGALVNLKGKLIGINTAIASRSGASNGIGFAIPINMAHDIMDDLIGHGSVTRGFLGVYLQAIDKNIQEGLGLKEAKGALVSKVIEDSPAEDAGLKEMDVITRVNGRKAKNVNDVRNFVAQLKPEKKYAFNVIRDGKPKVIKVKIGKREDDEVAQGTKNKKSKDYGLTLEDITEELAYQLRLSQKSGVVVTEVSIGTPADKAGFRVGDLIKKAAGQKVKKAKDFYKAIKESKKSTAMVMVERQGGVVFLGLKIGK